MKIIFLASMFVAASLLTMSNSIFAGEEKLSCKKSIKLAEEVNAHLAAGRMDLFVSYFTDDAVWLDRTSTFPWSGEFIGPNGIIQYFTLAVQEALPVGVNILSFECLDGGKGVFSRVIHTVAQPTDPQQTLDLYFMDTLYVKKVKGKLKIYKSDFFYDSAKLQNFINAL